ncbi:MAG: hypothetical protein FDZ75_00475 [Actinobacteria bacterium]|nr:MAG: hypothetical protein FDZ75_00475 [Actinomycetota bacterium]
MEIRSHIEAFFQRVLERETEIYNEFSLQHELGLHLRTAGVDHKVQFERPVEFFGISKSATTKREIDIAVFSGDRQTPQAIELKFPRNGQVPEQMFSACVDIAFLEDLVRAGFSTSYFVIVAEDSLFWQGRDEHGIYAPFRAGRPIHGLIRKPTGKQDATVDIAGSYMVRWQGGQQLRYAVVEVAQV